MDFTKDFLGYNFTWFIGEVEDRADPLYLGRVKVRCYGWHSSDKEVQPTAHLPWANTIQPVSTAARSPNGLNIGTWVFGFFLDGNKAQRPMVLGHIPGYRFGSPGISDLPAAARNEPDYPPPGNTIRDANKTEDVVIDPEAGPAWSEPVDPGDATYPETQVDAHESGFYTQTTGAGRHLIFSPSGTYTELAAGGDHTVKIVGDGYELIAGSNFVNVSGTVNLTVAGDVNWNIGGNWTVNVGGDVTHKVGGNVTEEVGGSSTESISGPKSTISSGAYTIDGTSINIG